MPALLQAEPGSDAVLSRALHGACCISTVNVTKVLTRLIDGGEAEAAFDALEPTVSAFDDVAARACAALRPASRLVTWNVRDFKPAAHKFGLRVSPPDMF